MNECRPLDPGIARNFKVTEFPALVYVQSEKTDGGYHAAIGPDKLAGPPPLSPCVLIAYQCTYSPHPPLLSFAIFFISM